MLIHWKKSESYEQSFDTQSFPDETKYNYVLYVSIRVCWYPNARIITLKYITSFDKSKVLYKAHRSDVGREALRYCALSKQRVIMTCGIDLIAKA